MRTVGSGRYELEAEIAKGAIGTVWRGRDTATGLRVAVKQLRPEAATQPELVEAFLAEWRILADLDKKKRDFLQRNVSSHVIEISSKDGKMRYFDPKKPGTEPLLIDNEAAAQRLWQASLELTHVSPVTR